MEIKLKLKKLDLNLKIKIKLSNQVVHVSFISDCSLDGGKGEGGVGKCGNYSFQV